MDKTLTPEEIMYRLKDLRPGEKVTYYSGSLPAMKTSVGNHLTARLAWDLHEEGKVHLVQKRLGPPRTHLNTIDWMAGYGPGFEYIAIGRSRRSRAPNFNAHLRSVMEAV